MSLPIKPIHIILSKFTYVYIINFLGAFISLVPSVIIYLIITKCAPIVLLNALIAIPFAPLFPLCLGFLLGTLINVIGSKVKNKTLFTTILVALFLGVYFYFVFSTGTSELTDEQLATMLVKMQGVFKVFFSYSKGITGNYLFLLAYVLFATVFAGLYFIFLSKYYKKINTIISTKRASANFKLQEEKTQSTSIIGALLKRELKLFFSDTTIIINNLLGPAFAILAGVAVLIKGGVNSFAGDLQLEVDGVDIAEIEKVLEMLVKNFVPYISVIFIGTCFYAGFCISIEGKNMWHVKALPISAKSYFNVKVLTHLIINLPASLICVILISISSKVLWYDLLIAIFMTIAYAVLDAVLGLTIDVRYHNFNWDTTAEVVKRGTSIGIFTATSFLGFIPLILIQILASFVSPYLGFAINFILICSLAFLFYKITYTNAEEKLLKM